MEVEIVPKYSFILSPGGAYFHLSNKDIQNLLQKWGINLKIQHFLFNEQFYQYHKYHFVEAFFKDHIVSNNLKIWKNYSFAPVEVMASHVDMNQVPCTVMSMSFFDRLEDPKNNIVHHSGGLRQRYDTHIDGIVVADNLRAMILDKECDEFSLYSKNERDEFIFCIFQMLVLGGEYCQYEDDLKSYLEVTKALYKDLVRIKKHEDNNTYISTIVLKVVAKAETPYFPKDPDHIQNIGFLLVDGSSREVTSFLHQYAVGIGE